MFKNMFKNNDISNNKHLLFNQQIKINNVKTINTKDGQMLLISDLEGCAEFTPSGVPQSTIECQEIFFNSINIFLSSNLNNKVAFLGDYFDKGPFALESITNIVKLHKDFKERVIIILGNRDINKLRIPYEIQELNINYSKNSDKYRWAEWIKSGLYDKISKEKEITEKIITILSTSMGAIPALRKKDEKENKNSYNKFVKQQTYNYFRHNKSLVKDLFTINKIKNSNIKEINFNENIIYLFSNSKIVHYDEDFEVLLSHAGGLAPELLEINIDSFIYNLQKLLISNPTLDYYQKIEIIRKDGLQIKNLIALVNKDTNKEVYKNFYNKNNKSMTNKVKFTTLIDKINLLLTSFIKHISTHNGTTKFNFNIEQIPPEYFILQAMGLKSDNSDYKFLSFIDSCDNTGCSGPNVDMDDEYYNYLKKLSLIGVKIIAHGHKPHCTPVPLIYKRNQSDIVFIDNDVSNGYRPKNINEVNKVPLSYISKNNEKLSVGVGFINEKSNIKSPNTNSISKLPESIKKFSFMLREWNISTNNGLNKIPLLDKKEVTYSKINYVDDKQELFFKKGFNPTDTKLF